MTIFNWVMFHFAFKSHSGYFAIEKSNDIVGCFLSHSADEARRADTTRASWVPGRHRTPPNWPAVSGSLHPPSTARQLGATPISSSPTSRRQPLSGRHISSPGQAIPMSQGDFIICRQTLFQCLSVNLASTFKLKLLCHNRHHSLALLDIDRHFSMARVFTL